MMKSPAMHEAYFSGTLKHAMPLNLRMRVWMHLVFSKRNKAKSETLMAELRHRRTITKPREQIEWFPSVDASLCNGCRICHDFCPKKVFEIKENTVTVARPYECVLLCSGCVPKCTQGAISFPPRDTFREFVVYS